MSKDKEYNTEYELFNKLSQDWWDENGKFKILHKIKPIRIKYIINQLNSKSIKKIDILDVGCGGGLISESLARLGADVTGIDFVEDNIVIAKNHSLMKGLRVNYIHGDVEKINIIKNFDLIIIFELLEHLDDWKSFILKISKKLKKNGIIIISTINRNLISKMLAIHFAEDILNWIPKGTHNYDKFIKPDEIINCAKENNLDLKDLTGLIFDPLEFNWRLSKNTKVNYFCSFAKN